MNYRESYGIYACNGILFNHESPLRGETLLGDATKALQKLGWIPKISFKELVAEMMRDDLKSAERDELVKKHGYPTYDYHE